MAEKAKAPAIRFKGFTEDWEQRKAIDIFRTTADKNHPDLPVLSATQEYGMILREDTGINISHDTENEATYKRVWPGQFVIHLRSFQGGFAHANVDGITSPAYTVMDFIEPKTHYDFFWKYIFSSGKFIKSLEKVTYGIRDGRSISYDDFSTMSFLYSGFGEQKAIGQLFQRLDHLITLHQRKLLKLKNVKTAMLEKMFPKNGSNVPEIRFAGFTDAWEQRKLGDLMEISSASRVHKNEWEDAGVPFFRSSDVVAEFKGTDNPKAFISYGLYEELVKKSGRVQKDDVLVTGGGSVGVPYLVKNNEPLYFKDADLIWLKNSGCVNGEFLFTFFTSANFRHYVNSIAHIGTISHYTIEQAQSTPIYLPNKDEQNMIGQFFKHLDNLITLHQRKLKKLQNVKKSMLEKMFV